MKKMVAVFAAATALVGISACGGNDPAPAAVASTTAVDVDAPISDWRTVGTEGLKILDTCSEHRDDAVMYACDHYNFLSLSNRIAMPKETSDIRNSMGAFQDSYQKYWSARQCGTDAADDKYGLMCNKKSLESVLVQVRRGFQNLADGNPVSS